MKTAVFGGSFDPVHIGHLFLASEVVSHMGFERVLFLPAAQPPHKLGGSETSDEHRLAMLRLALAPHDHFVISDWEMRKGGISYTFDSIHELSEQGLIVEKPAFIVGDDLLPGMHAWKKVHELLETVHLVIGRRNEITVPDFVSDYTCIDNLLLRVSSSDVRQRIAFGRPFRYLVPDAVYEYIHEHNLYHRRVDDAYGDSPK